MIKEDTKPASDENPEDPNTDVRPDPQTHSQSEIKKKTEPKAKANTHPNKKAKRTLEVTDKLKEIWTSYSTSTTVKLNVVYVVAAIANNATTMAKVQKGRWASQCGDRARG